MNATERKKARAYTDFAELVVALKDAVTELRRLTKRPKEDALLVECRVRILRATDASCSALVRGEGGNHRVHIYRDGTLLIRECSCEYGRNHPIRGGCSHERAVSKVWRPNLAATRSEGAERSNEQGCRQ